MPVTLDPSRFTSAQDAGGTYAAALAELQAGHKRTHWMWFVFPQVAGLGHSPTAHRYALSGLGEARAYLEDPVLGARLVECAATLTALPGRDAVAVFGSVDAMKLRSSMTLFALAAEMPPPHPEVGGAVFRRVLDQYFDGREDPGTLERL